MRSVMPAIALGVLLAACDSNVTEPRVAGRLPASPRQQLLIGGSAWSLVSLPFRPYGINSSNVIVGQQNGEAVRWENGALTVLPHRAGVAGPYLAKAISSKGYIVGSAGTHLLVWTLPNATPIDITSSSGVALWPVAINDSLTVVGNIPGWFGYDRAFRWTITSGLLYLGDTLHSYIATGLNASGYASGYVHAANSTSALNAVRFDPRGKALVILDGGGIGIVYASAINDNGIVLGTTDDALNGWSGFLWSGGTFSGFDAIPAAGIGVSNAGRIVGNSDRPWTYYNGTLTYLASPDTNPVPIVEGVNNCGSVIAVRQVSGDLGYLWKRGGVTTACDTPLSSIM